MGIESRDYLRSDDGPRSFGGAMTGTDFVKGLIIANVIVFVLQLLTARTHFVEYWLALGPDDVTQRFQVWRLLTYAFCHSTQSIFHILMNMYILYVTGRRIQAYYGPKEFLLFYLAAAILSGLGFIAMELVMGQVGYAIGASGAVASVFIVYAMRHPREQWLLFFVIPVQVKWLCILFILFDLNPLLVELGGGSAPTGIAHAAHLAGYLFGFLYERNNWRLSGLVSGISTDKLKLPKRRSHLKVYAPEDEAGDIEARVDELLQKVHEQGESSLTDEERALLTEASRRYRTRL